ncbi:MAG: hypothetical protein NC405_00755 [Odoribacter sp.]|nr:hypothetical protein [Odoribacter sp.]
MSFFNLLDPMFKYIDGGKLFRQPFMWLYYVIGVLTAFLCVYGVVQIIDMFKYAEGMGTLGLIFIMLVLLAMAVFSVIYWFKRAGDINNETPRGARFFAIPAIANLVRCFGEWASITFGIGGAVIALFAWIFASKYFNMGGEGIFAVVIFPVAGYVFIIFTRFLSETILATASIANDVHELATFNPPVDNNY